ncbi:MAG: cation transporting ATPase C-terminal domain-containing protein, partial [Chthoniobacterales bacterium]|nr:cation transporting ATPase C-terminal domain-containing protein [Chthoniobacterales bacterium]
ILLGTALPVLPVQILWVNMMTALLLGLMLVFEPKEHDLMERPPRDPAQPILTFALLMRTGLVCLFMLLGAFGMFMWLQQERPEAVAEARTAVVNVVVIVLIFYLLNCRSLTRSMWKIGVFSNLWVIGGIGAMVAAQLLFTYAPVMNRLFHSAPLGLREWLVMTGIGLTVYAVVGFEKWLRFHPKPEGAGEGKRAA